MSIAVLPFQNLSANPDNEYFGDGLAEELLNALAKVPDLQVAARTSSFSFKGKSETIGSIGRQLNVGAILEGSVRHSGTRIRIAAQLINVSDGFQLWSETYDRELTDIFTVQDAIARAIVAALKVELLGDIGSQLATRHAANVEAYNLYLRGRYQWHQRGPADVLDAAIQYFEQAIEADSSYALAYAGLADAYAVLPTYAPVSAREAFDRAHAAASKALDLDSTLAEAHASLGYIMDNRWEWIGAEQAYRRAIALNPNYATAHQWYGELLTWTGRVEEAVSETRRAYELDPLSPVINVMYAEALYYADSLEAALRQMKQALELSPNITPALRDLAFWYLAEQRLDEAFRTGLRWIEAGDHEREPFQQVWEGITGARPRAEALDALLAVENSANLDPYDYALLYAALGNDDKALDWLETAAEQKSTFMRLVAVQKLFADFRSQPRFRAVLSATGLY